MEEQKKPSNNDYTYEELRMMYLGKKPKKVSPACCLDQKQQSNVEDVQTAQQNVQPTQQAVNQKESESYEYLSKKYLNKGMASKNESPKKPRSTMQMICDIMLFCTLLLLCFLTIVFFAVPTTEIGGQIFYGKTLNLWDFVYGSENSIINQMATSAEIISSSDSSIDGVAQVMKMFRLLFLLVPAIMVAIYMQINLIFAIVAFSKKQSAKVANCLVKQICENLGIYIYFVFFGSISNGVGIDAYFVGYTVGKGLTFGMLFSLLIILTCAVCLFISEKRKGNCNKEKTCNWIRILLIAICFTIIAIVVTFMRMYSVFVYTLTSALTTVAGGILSGFSIETLIFPVLNLFLLSACLSIKSSAARGLTWSLTSLLCFGQKEENDYRKLQRKLEKFKPSFLTIVILSFLCLVSVIVLSIPKFGYGWSVNIFNHLLIIFIVASLGQTILGFFKTKKQKKQAVQKKENLIS